VILEELESHHLIAHVAFEEKSSKDFHHHL
jgi:hypothetical protein